jgi:ABC-type multidrug transport system fused ATPase/permease subunit
MRRDVLEGRPHHRAWLAGPALLILDEATSNLDVVTEGRLQQALSR